MSKRSAAKSPLDRFAMWLWAIVWRRWLIDHRGNQLNVVQVKGWRTALVESNRESRKTITPCFSFLGVKVK